MSADKRPCLVIAGPSGVGKSTVIEELEKRHPGVLGFSVSHTTRAQREGEVNGVDYHFVSVDEFEKLIANEELLEFAQVHGNYYGTSLAAITQVAHDGKLCVLDIDVHGARSARTAGIAGSYVFLTPPSIEQLEQRLRNRGTETEAQIQKRMQTTKSELAAVTENPQPFDHVICNEVLHNTVRTVSEIIVPHIETINGLRTVEQVNTGQAVNTAHGSDQGADTTRVPSNVDAETKDVDLKKQQLRARIAKLRSDNNGLAHENAILQKGGNEMRTRIDALRAELDTLQTVADAAVEAVRTEINERRGGNFEPVKDRLEYLGDGSESLPSMCIITEWLEGAIK